MMKLESKQMYTTYCALRIQLDKHLLKMRETRS